MIHPYVLTSHSSLEVHIQHNSGPLDYKEACLHSCMISVFLCLPVACCDLQLLYSYLSHLCAMIKTPFLILALLPPWLSPKTFCYELGEKSCTVLCLRHVSCDSTSAIVFTLTLGLECSTMECVL